MQTAPMHSTLTKLLKQLSVSLGMIEALYLLKLL